MDAAELDEYKAQLAEVQQSLQDDPDNAELQTLQSELKDLIQLTESYAKEASGHDSAAGAPDDHTPRHEPRRPKRDAPANDDDVGNDGGDAKASAPQDKPFVAGDAVLARWSGGDGRMYPAKVASVTGSKDAPMVTVKFIGYSATETLPARQVRRNNAPGLFAAAAPRPAQPAVSASRTPALSTEQLRERAMSAKKQKKVEKYEEKRRLLQSQQSWKKFANKGVKLGGAGGRVKIGEHSIFRTPEGVNGRVGYTGSGKPMTKNATERGKHDFSYMRESTGE